MRFALPVVVLAVLFFAPSRVSAQPAGSTFDYSVCMTGQRTAFEGEVSAYNPNSAASQSFGFIPPDALIMGAATCSQQLAVDMFVEDAKRLWVMLAIIVLVWTGVQMMLAGGFDLATLVTTLLSLTLPYAILEGYTAGSNMWGGIAFTDIFLRMGEWVSGKMLDGAIMLWRSELTNSKDWLFAKTAVADDWSGTQAAGMLLGGAVTAVAAYFLGFVTFGLFLVILAPPFLLYCQYLWGIVTLLVSVILGPIFAPFLLVPQLSFLFWGWIKSLFHGMVHMIVSSGLFVVVTNLTLMPLASLRTWTPPPDAGFITILGNSMAQFLVYIPIIVLCYTASLRVAEITALVTGGGMPGAGIGAAFAGFSPRGASGGKGGG